MSKRVWLGGLAGGLLLAAGFGVAMAQSERPLPAPAFTAAQAAEGQAAYAQACASCHGASLEGAAGPALAGNQFRQAWINPGLSVRDYHRRIVKTMPVQAPGSLSERQYNAVTAYILARNGYAAGGAEMAAANLDVKLTPPAGAPAPVAAGPKPASYPAAPANPGRTTATTGPDDAEFLNVKDADWLTYNRNLAGDRFSPLREITAANAGRLVVKCIYQLGELGSFQASPIVHDGKMYISSPRQTVALDAATCKPLWSTRYTPTGPEHIPSNRGVALYRGVVYRGTTDAHLLALDAATGKLLWDAPVADPDAGYFVSAAPLAFDGKVFVGEGGADHGIKGRIHAFDAATGKPLWSFDVIPTGSQPGAETWSGGQEQGGGSSWSSMAIDPAKRLVFAPTGNPGPDFNPNVRKGDNLYTDSVVALDMATGKLAWHVQQVPGDIHDWDTAAAPALFTLGGKDYMAVASKDGFLYLYDRATRATVAKSPTMTRVNIDVPYSTTAPVRYCPGGLGQWNGAAFSPALRMTFVGSADRCDTLILEDPPKYLKGQLFFGAKLVPEPNQKMSGWVRGFDALSGKQRWAYASPAPITAAMTPTAGGVLFTGDTAGDFLVFDAATGRILYRFFTGGGVSGGVSTYAAGGKQYVAVSSGNSSRGTWNTTGAATVVVFGLQ
jgi:PQQ-dependent dehydrogenase (methanol/ethanol family)